MIFRSLAFCSVLCGIFFMTVFAMTGFLPVQAKHAQADVANQSLLYPMRYSTFVAGSGVYLQDVAVDKAGNAIAVGYTTAHSLTVVNAYQPHWNCDVNWPPPQTGVIVKFNAHGNDVLFATYFGQGCFTDIRGVALDDEGNIYVAGVTYSPDIQPLDAFANSVSGQDGFIAKFGPTGGAPIFSGRLGGNSIDEITGIAVGANGSVYVAGMTRSDNLPVTENAYQKVFHEGHSDGFVARLDDNGKKLSFLTYLGGSEREAIEGIAVASDGSVYVTGVTHSTDFPLVNASPVISPPFISFTGFVTRVGEDGKVLHFSRFLGGVGETHAFAIAVDEQDNAYVTGLTAAADFPVTPDAYMTVAPDFGFQGFVASMNLSGTLRYGTYFGGAGGATYGFAIAVDAKGRAYVAGQTLSQALPQVHPVQEGYAGGPREAFVLGFDANAKYLRFASYLGTSKTDEGKGIAVDKEGNIYTVGHTDGQDWPTTPDAYLPKLPADAPNLQHSYVTAIKALPLPLIFIHGVAGSRLWLAEGQPQEVWPVGSNKLSLSLYPTETRTVVARTLITKLVDQPGVVTPPAFEFYFPILHHLTEELGYIPYQVDPGLARQTSAGCDLEGQRDAQPNLFVFVYDWRHGNDSTAIKLGDYIACVQSFYPDTQVNLLAHSMGGLVARRYILNRGDEHDVEKLITVGSPFLGAPKLVHVVESGDFVPIISPGDTKHVVPSFPAASELMASRTYISLTGDLPLGARGFDLNRNDSLEEEYYDYDTYIFVMNEEYGRQGVKPGTIGHDFHSVPGQDDWNGDQSGIEYHHLVGRQGRVKTIGSTLVTTDTVCSGSDKFLKRCEWGARVGLPSYVPGDGTVPVSSAERIGAGQDLNAPGAHTYCFVHANLGGDSMFVGQNDLHVEHTGLFLNPNVLQLIEHILDGNPPTGSTLCPDTTTASQHLLATDPLLTHYTRFINTEEIAVTDLAGNSLRRGWSTDAIAYVPDVRIDVLGERSQMALLPNQGVYSVTAFVDAPFGIEIRTGQGETVDRLQRYQDVTLEDGQILLLFSEGSEPILRYDSNGDGHFDRVIPPTHVEQGPLSMDRTPPTVLVTVTVQSHAQAGAVALELAAEDSGSGVDGIYYATDGISYTLYSEILLLDPMQTPRIHVFADDRVGNRAPVQVVELSGDPAPDSRTYIPALQRD